jgi:hypothetical protein
MIYPDLATEKYESRGKKKRKKRSLYILGYVLELTMKIWQS